MRIDLANNDDRPLFFRLAMAMVRRVTGLELGPLLLISYERRFIAGALKRYILRGMRGQGAWTKGEAELFAGFVSSLNSCRF
ncbi:MAG: hypothetical protein HY906_04950 [Deltaproteobacteria bacterium]|nr:hypothetical protein [Deltaproteobacteria bacterium]